MLVLFVIDLGEVRRDNIRLERESDTAAVPLHGSDIVQT